MNKTEFLTPKEKAMTLWKDAGKTIPWSKDWMITAKKIALLSAQTVIDATPEITNVQEYWKEVKFEIEKILTEI